MANTYGQKVSWDKPVKQAVGIATVLAAPVVKHNDLLNAKHHINDCTLSGKQAGAIVVVEDNLGSNSDRHSIAVATGDKAKDPWEVFSYTADVAPTKLQEEE